jgi:hypothetical protein
LDDKDICEDDFPDAKVRKTVIVKETAKRTVKRPFEPLVFKLLRYFEAKEVVYILDGYVCKVLDSLINSHFLPLLKILEKYNKFSSVETLFGHIDSTSVQEVLLSFIGKTVECNEATP